ncbi:abortive infection family protein [Dongia sedimenti]|uniref:Abortive infection family protein n=1 Tax=Dongia sedimenti TaxID=3064282 RepID=A0ABU0YTM4_9PROT|nr:abortive infection family protein [Rhodospirillaceae bacterium R-7]
MVSLKHSEMRVFDDAFDMNSGYVLDFTDRTMREFFDDEFGIDIYQEKYRFNGSSKAKHLRALIKVEDEYTVARVARALWQYRESLPRYQQAGPEAAALKMRFFDLISRIEGGGAVPRTDALDRFKRDETLEELIAAIERDIAANKPAAALDRLHTYCMKKFARLLDERRIARGRDDPLQSRVGKYVKALEAERDLREITRRIIKSAISVFEQFNDIRNNRSFAHDNDLIDQAEARFIFDAVSAFLRFVKSIEASHFGA